MSVKQQLRENRSEQTPLKIDGNHLVSNNIAENKQNKETEMGECDLIETCPFFNDKIKTVNIDTEQLKEKYCKNNNLNCARYMIVQALGREKVPDDLLPDQKTTAYQIIAES